MREVIVSLSDDLAEILSAAASSYFGTVSWMFLLVFVLAWLWFTHEKSKVRLSVFLLLLLTSCSIVIAISRVEYDAESPQGSIESFETVVK